MRDYAHIAARVFDTPLLIHPRKAEIIAGVVAQRIAGAGPSVEDDAAPPARATMAGPFSRFSAEDRGAFLFRDGLALVTVEGSLVNRGAWVGASSGLTSYEGVAAQLRSAADDADVREIVLDLESPGGEAIGAFEMAAVVRQIAARKPVTAFVNGMAASAAYAMASGATRIVTSPSGVSGSIGVVLLHMDRSRELEMKGVTPTLIYAGDHKVDGNPFAPLPDSVRADLQAEVDQRYRMFVATVAAGRPALTEQAIRATQARTYIGEDAVRVGLADQVGVLDDIVRASASSARRKPLQQKGTSMSDISNSADLAAPMTIDASAEQIAAARTDATAQERARCKAILSGDEAKGRAGMAAHLAFETDMPAASAAALLAASPKDPGASATASLAARFDAAVPRPGVSADAAPPRAAAAIDTAAIYARVNGR